MDDSIKRVAAGLMACCSAVGACTTNGEGDRTDVSSRASEDAPLLCEGCELVEEQAGGETSEFSGGIPICEIGSSVSRALSDPNLASMLGWVEGRHELSFRWRPNFVTSEVRGYSEETSVALEVRVTGAREVDLPGCHFDDLLLLDLAVDIATSDGSLRGTVTQTVALDRAGYEFSTTNVDGDSVTMSGQDAHSLDNFRGSLALGLEHALAPSGSMSVVLSFKRNGVRGRLRPIVSNASAEPWSPLDGLFPDDGCPARMWGPVPMNRPLASLNGETLSTIFEEEIRPWTSSPLPARWTGGVPAEINGVPTEVNLVVGGAEQACQASPEESPDNGFLVRAPLRVWSADGRLDVVRSATFGVLADPSRVTFDAPFVPAGQLSSSGELGYTLHAAAIYAVPEIRLNYWDGGVEGSFHVETVPWTANADTQWLTW